MVREEILRPSVPAFTVPEVSALLDVPERRVRKEIELGVLPESSPPRLSFDAIVGLLAFAAFEDVLALSTSGRKSLYTSIRDALAHWHPDRALDDIVYGEGLVRIQLERFAREARARVEPFLVWKERRVVSDPAILGGEPVFAGSRLSVRHIGGLPPSEMAGLLEDYPYLSADDIHFAGVFTRAYPRLGRPRESSKAADG